MKICSNNLLHNQTFRAKLSPSFRKMVGDYRQQLRTNKQFNEFNHLRTTMVKIKFLCPGKEITEDYFLDGKIRLLPENISVSSCNNMVLDELLKKLEIINKLS